MLATGDGTPSLKFGSTNAYTEDASGKPVYDWTITDRIMDTYLQAGAKPFVEIGFMPKALSSHPEPYTPVWKPGGQRRRLRYRLVVSAERLREVGRTGESVGEARGGRSMARAEVESLVLGSVE